MPVIDASDCLIRPNVKRYLRNVRSENPHYTVIDIGGALNPWCDEFVTTYVDINEVSTKREVLIGNFMEEAFWEGIRGRSWDFAICTHVLEDIRDPLFLVKKILRIVDAGFIAVPNKHTELSPVESPQYPGYYHHRWIFTLEGQVLRAIAKLPLLGYYRSANKFPIAQ
ncbi:MAG: hypothetical protein JRJ85_05630 [Deltaproteobacteria bacterium]|nr:hypothetical protein [Deltaproteobacteria bacterium]